MIRMSPTALDLVPPAIREANRARRRYARISSGTALGFVRELDNALAQIAAAPQQWAPYLHGTRVYQLRRFPYLVIYREYTAFVRVYAVAHTSRQPGYWRRRLP